MKKLLVLTLGCLFFSGCSRCTTEVCVEEKKIQIELQMQQEIKKLELYNEKLKIEAEIEANKPVEVRIAETQAQQTTLGDGLVAGASVAEGLGLLYIILN